MPRFGFPKITPNAHRALDAQLIPVIRHDNGYIDILMDDDTRVEKLKMFYGEVYVYLLRKEIVLIYNPATKELDIPHDFDERDRYRDRLLNRASYQDLPMI